MHFWPGAAASGAAAIPFRINDFHHQTWQEFSRTMACPGSQLKAFWNSGMFDTTPLTRNLGGEWGFALASTVSACGVQLEHQTCP
jgi:hypothetical protein